MITATLDPTSAVGRALDVVDMYLKDKGSGTFRHEIVNKFINSRTGATGWYEKLQRSKREVTTLLQQLEESKRMGSLDRVYSALDTIHGALCSRIVSLNRKLKKVERSKEGLEAESAILIKGHTNFDPPKISFPSIKEKRKLAESIYFHLEDRDTYCSSDESYDKAIIDIILKGLIEHENLIKERSSK